jgi:hypothetical protein
MNISKAIMFVHAPQTPTVCPRPIPSTLFGLVEISDPWTSGSRLTTLSANLQHFSRVDRSQLRHTRTAQGIRLRRRVPLDRVLGESTSPGGWSRHPRTERAPYPRLPKPTHLRPAIASTQPSGVQVLSRRRRGPLGRVVAGYCESREYGKREICQTAGDPGPPISGVQALMCHKPTSWKLARIQDLATNTSYKRMHRW